MPSRRLRDDRANLDPPAANLRPGRLAPVASKLDAWLPASGPSDQVADCAVVAGGKLVGLRRLVGRGDRAEVGGWILPPARGRGHGTRSLRLVCDRAFAVLGLRWIEALIEPANVRPGPVQLAPGSRAPVCAEALGVGARHDWEETLACAYEQYCTAFECWRTDQLEDFVALWRSR